MAAPALPARWRLICATSSCSWRATAPTTRPPFAEIVSAIDSGRYDFVIGSRVRGKREPGSLAGHQIFAGRTAGLLIGLLYGVHYTDIAAMRAIRRDTLLTLGMRELTYGWNLEMQMPSFLRKLATYYSVATRTKVATIRAAALTEPEKLPASFGLPAAAAAIGHRQFQHAQGQPRRRAIRCDFLGRTEAIPPSPGQARRSCTNTRLAFECDASLMTSSCSSTL
jgi:hypothetical protein